MDRFLEELAEPTPTPAGGAASCYVGAAAAALVEMVAGFAAKKGQAAGPSLAARARDLRAAFIDQAAEDSSAYQQVLLAYRRPRDDPDRPVSIARALREATLSPLQVLDLAIALAEAIQASGAICPEAMRSDWESAAVLCGAVARVCANNATDNLGSALGADELRALLDEKLERFARTLPNV